MNERFLLKTDDTAIAEDIGNVGISFPYSHTLKVKVHFRMPLYKYN